MERSKFGLSRSFSLFNRKSSAGSENTDLNSSPPWKFWRRFSSRRRQGNKRHKEKRAQPISEKTEQLTEIPEVPVTPTPSGLSRCPLPDVVEEAPGGLRRHHTPGVPPPKPPRLFLIRNSGNLNQITQENQLDPVSSSPTCDDRISEKKSRRHGQFIDPAIADSLAVFGGYFSCQGKSLGLENNNNFLEWLPETNSQTAIHFSSTPESPVSTDSKGDSASEPTDGSNLKYFPPLSVPKSTTPRPRRKTPECSRKWPGRSFRRASEKGDNPRQKHIMNSVSELIRQRLDPYPLMDQLKRSGILTNVDVQSFLGHHNRKSVCEGIVGLVGDSADEVLSVFSNVLMRAENCTEIAEILQVMREMDKAIHDVPCSNNTEFTVLSEEKSFNFEVGYLAPDYSLKPLVELERARSKRDKHLSKASCRNSSYSLLEASGTESATYPGLIMMGVTITGHNLSGPRAEALSRIIQSHSCISELHLGKSQLWGEDVQVLSTAMENNRTVHLLDLRLNNIDYKGATAIAKLLQKSRSLRHLNLSSTCLDVDSLNSVIAAVAYSNSLTDIDLSFLDIGDDICVNIRDMLRGNMALRKLRLRSNSVTRAGCAVLCEGLVGNQSLSVLDLSRNTIGDHGVQALARCLPESGVKEVILEGCNITSTGCVHLADLTLQHKKLRTLDISSNAVLDAGIYKLVAALDRTSSLESLGLNMCGITDDGFVKLLDLLDRNTSILNVKLCYNQLGHNPTDLCSIQDLRHRLNSIMSSSPNRRILLWGNAFDEQ